MTITVRWPDGARSTAPDAETLIDALAREQEPPVQTRLGMKDELAWRSEVWAREAPRRRGTARAFLDELERLGLLVIEEG